MIKNKNKKDKNEEILVVSNFDFKSGSSNETVKMVAHGFIKYCRPSIGDPSSLTLHGLVAAQERTIKAQVTKYRVSMFSRCRLWLASSFGQISLISGCSTAC